MKSLYLAAVLILLFLNPRSALACPEANGLVDNNCDGRVVIVCFGDSITYGRRDAPLEIGYPGRLKQRFPNAEVYNLGKPGEDTFAGRARATNVISQINFADYFVLLEGVNDFYQPERSADVTRDNLLTIQRMSRSTGAVSFLAKLTDIKRDYQRNWVLSVNNRLVNLAQIDFFTLGKGIIGFDQIHPHAGGYNQMGALVGNLLLLYSAQHRPVDSDNDGIYDYYESRIGANPFVNDTDHDGLLDGAEVFQYHSSPLALDTDGDGLTDPEEVNLGSDPSNPNPTPPKLKSFKIL